jgi:nitroimidazol reductase NimA-like FMN-containing flavoprotein (pyridoxamine 5'-phosphate oxidase superfamily)
MTAGALSILGLHGALSVATTSKDGWPAAAMTGYVNDGLVLYFRLARDGRTFENITADSRVFITIGCGARAFCQRRVLAIAAEAFEVADDPFRADILKRLAQRRPEDLHPTGFDPVRSAVVRALPRLVTVSALSEGEERSVSVAPPGGEIAARVS